MARSTYKLVSVIEQRFGIESDFVKHLAPMIERFAASAPSAQEWDGVLAGIAAAYRARAPMDADTAEELAVLLSDFGSELEKIGESLRVLDVYIARVQRHLEPPTPRRFIH